MPIKIKTFDFSLFITPLIFLAVSVAAIYSLFAGTSNENLGFHQALFAMLGLAVMIIISFIDYRFFKGTAWIFYLISIILLVFVEFFGKTAKGATNWLSLGFFQLQPSEVAKVFLLLTLAAFFSEKVGKIRFRDILLSLLLVIPPVLLVLKEPDFGSAAVIFFIFVAVLIISRPSKLQYLIISTVLIAIFSVATLAYLKVGPFSSIFKDYQRQRIAVFLKPDLDPYGHGYNVKQAQITLGSGGITGRGLGRGSQSQLQFLPEPHTDFIIAGIGESFGFLGIFILMSIYCFFILRMINIASLARDNFGMLAVFGITAMFFIQIFINVGMNTGLVPVTGITLPLLSYGGTSLIVSLFSIGIIQSIFIHHKKINF